MLLIRLRAGVADRVQMVVKYLVERCRLFHPTATFAPARTKHDVFNPLRRLSMTPGTDDGRLSKPRHEAIMALTIFGRRRISEIDFC